MMRLFVARGLGLTGHFSGRASLYLEADGGAVDGEVGGVEHEEAGGRGDDDGDGH